MSDPLERVDIKSLRRLVRLRARREETAQRALARARAAEEEAREAWEAAREDREAAREDRRRGEAEAYGAMTGRAGAPGDLHRPQRAVARLQARLDAARDRQADAARGLARAEAEVEAARATLRAARDELRRWRDMEETASTAQSRLASRREEEAADDELLDRIGGRRRG